MEYGTAASVITARAAMWNSGRLESMSATVSPRRTPSFARPPARASTRSRSSAHVKETESSIVRTATRSPWSSTVSRNASTIERAPTERRVAGGLADIEASVGQPADVVREADDEQREHECKADEAGPLHDAEGDRAAADLLRQRPEDVATVERQEREQVDHAERERDHREQEHALLDAELDALARDLVGADHARDLLALLGLEDLGDRLDGPAREEPHLVQAQPGGRHRAHRRPLDVEQEAEQRPLLPRAVDRLGAHGEGLLAPLGPEDPGGPGAGARAAG